MSIRILPKHKFKVSLQQLFLHILELEDTYVDTPTTYNSPSQDSNHPDDLFQSRYVTPGFKPFSYTPTLVNKISKMNAK